MKTIPVSMDLLSSQVTTLSGQDYILTFAWNPREEAWYMDVADQDGNVLACSRKVVVDFPLIYRPTDPRLPKGVFYAIDTTDMGQDPGRDDFGTRVHLIYVEPGDL